MLPGLEYTEANHSAAPQKANENGVNKPFLKLSLLKVLGQKDFAALLDLVETKFVPKDDPNVLDVKRLVLHYAVQVAPLVMVKEIIKNWSQIGGEQVPFDVNFQDKNGNTALHLAVSQSRYTIVEYLLDLPDLNECLENNHGLQAIELCKDIHIAQMMQAHRDSYLVVTAEKFRNAFNRRDFNLLESIIKNPKNKGFLDINGVNPNTGDTVLHEFTKKKDIDMCKWLLDHGADPWRRDSRGKLPLEILSKFNDAKATELSRILDSSMKKTPSIANKQHTQREVHVHSQGPTYKGFLRKRTNIAQGYKLRWFVLSSDGRLSYYKSQNHHKNGSKSRPRGTILLKSCQLNIDSSEKLKFDLISGNQKWKLKGSKPEDTNNWIWAIQSSIRYLKDQEIAKKSGHTTTTPFALSHGKRSTSTIDTNKSAQGAPNVTKNAIPAEDIKHLPKPPVIGKAGHSRNQSASFSATSSDIELNSNLTESGKRYISKVIENRLDSGSQVALGNESDSNSGMNSNYEEDYDDDSEEYLGINEGPMSDLSKDLDGPYSEKINVLRKYINIEMSSLIELLGTQNVTSENWNILRESLTNANASLNKMNDLVIKRDEKLLSYIAKQGEVNNVWIQTVKELELELTNNGQRLETLDKQRKLLKRSLTTKRFDDEETRDMPESTKNRDLDIKETNQSSTAFEHILNFINATNQDDNDSNLRDADELIDELGTIPDSIMQTPIDLKRHTSSVSRSSINLPTSPLRDSRTTETVPEEDNSDESTTVKGANISVVDEMKGNKPHGLEKPVKVNRDENKAHAEIANVGEEPQKKISSTKKTNDEAEKIPSNNEEAEEKISAPSKLNSVAKTKPQSEKEKLLQKEGSFLGYEDGIRKRLKMDEDDRPKISLWAVLKSMVGKDMTRMTLPVTFNEPTSLLQRVTEDLEYSELLDKATSFEDSTLRMLYVAVFTASSYASTTKRVAKPFNPLLGETFEYARPDKNYRFLAEQVSHHPPISATWTESPKWDFFGESYVDTKFNGRAFNVKHLGLWYIRLRPDCQDTEELYTWKKPNNTVIGILVGNPQVDNHGEVKVVNHNTGDYCILSFKARGWKSSSAYEVKGEVFNSKKQKVWALGGHWHDSIYARKVNGKHDGDMDLGPTGAAHISGSAIDVEPTMDGKKFLVWKVNKRPQAPFNLTPFAITLNAPQPKLLPWLPRTDTRLRPDQRAMEDGQYDTAADEKARVEDKQREARKLRNEKNITYEPQWFHKGTHPTTKQPYWKFNGKYWGKRKEHDMEEAADIF